jgi:hypothetical protein
VWGPVANAGALDRDGLDLMLDVRAEQHRARALASLFDARWSRLSSLGSLAALGRARAVRRRYHGARDRYLEWVERRHAESEATAGPPFGADRADLLELVVRSWAENSRSLQGLCDARSIDYLHVLQPTLHDEGSKRLTETELSTAAAPEAWIEGARFGYPRLREAGRELREDGVHFLDASMLFLDEPGTLYVDNCHYNEEGRRLLTMAIAEGFLASLPEGASGSASAPRRDR